MHRKNQIKTILQAAIIIFITASFIIPGTAFQTKISEEKERTLRTQPSIISSTIYVDDSNSAGPWDGSQDHPYQYIQDGIDHATTGDTVFVYEGIYRENIDVPKALTIIGEHRDTTIIDGTKTDTTVRLTSDGITLQKFTIQNSGLNPHHAGIYITTQNNNIIENTLRNNHVGINFLDTSNTMYHNNFIENDNHGSGETTNTLDKNYWDTYTGADDNENGIGDSVYEITLTGLVDTMPLMHPYGSITNSDTEEIFYCIQHAIHDSDTCYGHIILVKNGVYTEHLNIYKTLTILGESREKTIIDGREHENVISFCADEITLTGFTIQNSGKNINNAGIIIQSDENMISNTIIKNNYHGMYLKLSADDNTITNNIIVLNSWNGIYLKSSTADGNKIIENLLRENGYAGVGISESSYNMIYHNSFVDNLHNAYDNGNNIWDDENSSGNYWDDYTGLDGDGDGVGDTPYSVADGINKDRHPLMEPYGSGDTTPPLVTILSPQNGLYLRDHRLFSSLLKRRIILIGDTTIEVAASDSGSGIYKVEFYIDNNPTPAAIDYEAPYSWKWTKNPSRLQHKHMITIVAFDHADNINMDAITVRKYF